MPCRTYGRVQGDDSPRQLAYVRHIQAYLPTLAAQQGPRLLRNLASAAPAAPLTLLSRGGQVHGVARDGAEQVVCGGDHGILEHGRLRAQLQHHVEAPPVVACPRSARRKPRVGRVVARPVIKWRPWPRRSTRPRPEALPASIHTPSSAPPCCTLCMHDNCSTGLRLLLWTLPGAHSSFPPPCHMQASPLPSPFYPAHRYADGTCGEGGAYPHRTRA